MSLKNRVALASFISIAASIIFIIFQLHPSLLFLNTTTTGGDTGAHVVLPAFLEHHLLPHGRITGWDPQWFAGFPAFTFYFPLPALIMVFFNLFFHYNIAFKLVTVLGSIAFPISMWAFGKLFEEKAPIPATLGVISLGFLFETNFTIEGGNLASTLAGEYAFSLSLAIAMVFLGLVFKGMKYGKYRSLSAVLFALMTIAHIVPAFFTIVGSAVLLLMQRQTLGRWRWMITMALTGAGLAGFWLIPFALRLNYTTNMGWQNFTNYTKELFPLNDLIVFILAGLGVILSLVYKSRLGIFSSIMAVLSALFFIFLPQSKLWNGRILPFWFLCLYILAAFAIARVGITLSEAIYKAKGVSASQLFHPGAMLVPILALALIIDFVGGPLGVVPSWMSLPGSTPSFVPAWIKWNYSGYQKKPAWPEYHSVIQMMSNVSKKYGCGRAMWEYEPQLNRFGTPMALMLLPYWTHNCVDSMEGLFFESSATTPYHFINQSELSMNPSDAMVGLPYPGLNLNQGVKHLQLLGVRYYLTFSPFIQQQASTNSNLVLLGSTGPWPVQYPTGVKERTWMVYKVIGSKQVVGLHQQPFILNHANNKQVWLKKTLSWYLNTNPNKAFFAASGPKNWIHTSSINAQATKKFPSSGISKISTGISSISFQVAHLGYPVLVKTSYFPNWVASGAKGPWRISPNLMVVIPTSHSVKLTYAHTPVGLFGDLVTFLSLVAAIYMARKPPLKVDAKDRSITNMGNSAKGGQPKTSFGLDKEITTTSEGLAMVSFEDIFKAYDVRGIVPDQIDAAKTKAIGASFAQFALSRRKSIPDAGISKNQPLKIIIGRDMRPSGEELSHAFAQGVMSQGVGVIDIGLCSTDLIYFAAGHLDFPAVMFTASHNPAQYNGIKFCLAKAQPVGQDSGLDEVRTEAEAFFEQPPIKTVAAEPESAIEHMDLLQDYVKHVISFVDVTKLRPLKVVADTANGMGGLVVPAVFEKLPFELEILYPELDGTFPNHPADPIQPKNQKDLKARVLQTGADIGLAFDGDADRVFIVDEKGQGLSGSLTTSLVAASMLEKHPQSTILYNLICSKAVPAIVTENGGHPIRTRVGHSFIKKVMAETGAVFGGEHSGHYYFADNYRADSGLIAAVIILEAMSKSSQPLSQLRQKFERYVDSGEINIKVHDSQAVIKQIQNHFRINHPQANLDLTDGLTVDLEQWWFNLRSSNTEPLLRLNVEADDVDQCKQYTLEVLELIKSFSKDAHVENNLD